jgi:hypothetical protein
MNSLWGVKKLASYKKLTLVFKFCLLKGDVFEHTEILSKINVEECFTGISFFFFMNWGIHCQ